MTFTLSLATSLDENTVNGIAEEFGIDINFDSSVVRSLITVMTDSLGTMIDVLVTIGEAEDTGAAPHAILEYLRDVEIDI